MPSNCEGRWWGGGGSGLGRNHLGWMAGGGEGEGEGIPGLAAEKSEGPRRRSGWEVAQPAGVCGCSEPAVGEIKFGPEELFPLSQLLGQKGKLKICRCRFLFCFCRVVFLQELPSATLPQNSPSSPPPPPQCISYIRKGISLLRDSMQLHRG